MKKKKKILILSHTFVKKINLSLPIALSKKEKIDVLCVSPKKILQNNKIIYPDYKRNSIGVKIIYLDLKNKSIRTQYFKNFKEIIEKEKPNIIFLDNDTVCIQSLILIFWSFFYNFKIYYFCNENNLKNIFKFFTLKKFVKLLIIYVCNFFLKFRIDKVFCYTKQIKENYDFLGYKNKTKIIPLGFDENIFFNKKKKIKSQMTISYFGRIIPEKGIHVLIEALKLIKNYSWIFMIDVEHIEDKRYFKKLKINLKNNFKKSKYRFIKCNHNEVAKFMRLSDILVLPSVYEEQYGRVIQEAIACGNVAIGSKIGAIPEIIKDKKLLFEPNNHISLSLILKSLFNKGYYMKKLKLQKKEIFFSRSIKKQSKLILKNI